MVRVCGGCRITDGGGAGEGDCASGLMVCLLWCPGVYTLNAAPLATQGGPSNGQWIAHCILRMHGEACSSHSLKLVASMLVYIPYTGRFPIAIYQIGGAPGSPTTNFYIAKIPAPLIFDPDPIGGFQNHRRVVKCGDFHWHLLLFQYHLIACLGSP